MGLVWRLEHTTLGLVGGEIGVQTSGDQVVYFVVTDGVESRQISADCSSGTLGGQEPADASEAQLLNAACQVAFGA